MPKKLNIFFSFVFVFVLFGVIFYFNSNIFASSNNDVINTYVTKLENNNLSVVSTIIVLISLIFNLLYKSLIIFTCIKILKYITNSKRDS